jgi:hypothetical protein
MSTVGEGRAWGGSIGSGRRTKAAGADGASVTESGRAQWWRMCVGMKVKWGRLSSARRGAEIRLGQRGAVATNGVRLPPHHRSRCVRARVTGTSRLSGSCG